MGYKAGASYAKEFTTANPSTGAAVNADSLPTATANKNGTDDGAFSLTVTNIDTGRYKVTGTVPAGYRAGDVLNVTVAATVNAVAGKAWVDTQVIEEPSVVQTGTATAGGASTITLASALGADNICNGATLSVVAGTGSGQTRIIVGYVNSTQVATVDNAWAINPDNTSVYVIRYTHLPATDVNENVWANVFAINGVKGAAQALQAFWSAATVVTVQAGSPTTTSFVGQSGLSTTDNFAGYVKAFLVPLTGNNVGAYGKQVSSYVGGTRTFNCNAFPLAPAPGDTFLLVGQGA